MMKKTSFILIFVSFGLVGVGLFYHFFYRTEPEPSRLMSQSRSNSLSQRPQSTAEIAAESSTNHVTILYTGNTQSYLEPCGCYVGQSGGIARRGTLIDNVRKEGIVPFVLDAGNFLDGKTFLDRLRGETYLKAMNLIGYDAINLGNDDSRFGLDFFEELSKKESLPFVSTNLSLPPGAPHFVQPHFIKEISGVRTAVLGLSQPSDGEFKWQDPLLALKQTISQVKESADLLILLSQLSTNINRQLAGELKEIDLIISSHEGETETVEQTLLVYSNPHGKYLERLDLKLDAEAKIGSYEITSLSMDERVPDHPHVRNLLTQFYESVAKNSELQKSADRLFANQFLEGDPQNGYVGAKSCESCHTREYNQWQTTEHAFAYNTLLEKQRHFYPDCVSCHTTGFGYETGYHISQAKDVLANVQCETCHGPGRKHITQPRKTNIRKEVPVELCSQCHNAEHSPNFMVRAKELIPLVNHSRRSKKAAALIEQRVGIQNQVKIELFVMSQCPYGTAAEKEIIPTIQEYQDRIDFQIYHIAREDKTTRGASQFKSLHGAEETAEGIRQVVIAKYYPERHLDYLLCRTENFRNPEAWIDCAKQVGIDVDKVRQIANTPEGEALFRENIRRGRLLGIDTSPTFIIDGHRYTNELFDKSSCYQKSDLVPVRYHIKNLPIQSIVGDSHPQAIPAEEYASTLATLEEIRQKLNLEAASESQLREITTFSEEAKTLQALSQKYPSNLSIGLLLAEVYREQGMEKFAAQQYKSLGFILNNEWMLIGPFKTNRWASGFRKRYPPEKEIDFTAVYDSQLGLKVSWIKPSYDTVSAYVDLKPLLKCDVCASYAYAVIEVPMEMEVQIRYDVYGMAKLWVNEEKIHSKKEMDLHVDGNIVATKLSKGKNRILLKVAAQGAANGFIFRITDLRGQPIPDLKVVDSLPEI